MSLVVCCPAGAQWRTGNRQWNGPLESGSFANKHDWLVRSGRGGDRRHEPASEPVVREVPEAAGDSAGGFDDTVDGFGGSVGGAMGVEVGQDRLLSGMQGPAEAGDFSGSGRPGTMRSPRSRAAAPALLRSGVMDRAELLVALPSQSDVMAWVPAVSFASSRAACLSVRCSAPICTMQT